VFPPWRNASHPAGGSWRFPRCAHSRCPPPPPPPSVHFAGILLTPSFLDERAGFFPRAGQQPSLFQCPFGRFFFSRIPPPSSSCMTYRPGTRREGFKFPHTTLFSTYSCAFRTFSFFSYVPPTHPPIKGHCLPWPIEFAGNLDLVPLQPMNPHFPFQPEPFKLEPSVPF